VDLDAATAKHAHETSIGGMAATPIQNRARAGNELLAALEDAHLAANHRAISRVCVQIGIRLLLHLPRIELLQLRYVS
jgi:hypothetical protein